MACYGRVTERSCALHALWNGQGWEKRCTMQQSTVGRHCTLGNGRGAILLKQYIAARGALEKQVESHLADAQ